MNRRQLLASLGVIAGGSATAIGTGAFSSTEATRNVDVKVADDTDALLGLQPTANANGNYVDQTSNDALAINLTGSNENIGDGIAGGEGVNANALTSINNMFEIRNQGTQTVEVTATPLAYLEIDSGLIAVMLVPHNAPEYGLGFLYPPSSMTVKPLGPGEKIKFGLVALPVPESAIDGEGLSDQLEITAEAM